MCKDSKSRIINSPEDSEYRYAKKIQDQDTNEKKTGVAIFEVR